jgi:predicted dehydrogenase
MACGINRREFMGRSLVAAAVGPAVARYTLAADLPQAPVGPNDRIQLGIIGVGARVHSGLLQAALAVPGVEVVGVCDAYRGRVQRAIERTDGRARDYGSTQALLADEGIDAVIIATPDHLHRSQTLAALAAGKDVYLEKPMTLTIDEGGEMIAAAERLGRILQIGSQGMSSKLQETARDMVRSGRLGQVTMVRASYNRNSASGAWLYPIPPDASEKTVDWEAFLGPAPEKLFSPERFFRWRCYWDYSGGIATDLFVHLMTTIHYVMGAVMPEIVMAIGDNYRYRKTHEVPDTLNAVARYKKEGFEVNLSATFNNQASAEGGFEIIGSEAALVFRGGEMVFKPEHHREDNGWIVASWPRALEEAYYARPEVQALESPGTWDPKMEKETEVYRQVGRDATLLHVARFLDSVRSRKAPVEDGRAGHHAAAVAHMVNESILREQPVYWDFAADALRRA